MVTASYRTRQSRARPDGKTPLAQSIREEGAHELSGEAVDPQTDTRAVPDGRQLNGYDGAGVEGVGVVGQQGGAGGQRAVARLRHYSGEDPDGNRGALGAHLLYDGGTGKSDSGRFRKTTPVVVEINLRSTFGTYNRKLESFVEKYPFVAEAYDLEVSESRRGWVPVSTEGQETPVEVMR